MMYGSKTKNVQLFYDHDVSMQSDSTSVLSGLKKLVACHLRLPANEVKLKQTRKLFDILLFGKRTCPEVCSMRAYKISPLNY